MKHKKAVRDGNKSRMLVHVPTEVQDVVRQHMAALGSTGGHAVMRLIQLGDSAYRRQTATVEKIRTLMQAESGISGAKPAFITLKVRNKRVKRPSRAKAQHSTASSDAKE